MTIPEDHLRACQEHGVVDDHEHPCPCCVADLRARPGYASNTSFTQQHLRFQMDSDTIVSLTEALSEWAEEAGEPEPWVSVAQIPVSELAAGYTRQERWFNVVQFESQNSVRTVASTRNAEDMLDRLHAGEDPVERKEFGVHRFDPEWWEKELDLYGLDAEAGPLAEKEGVRIEVDGFVSDDHYSEARRALGSVAESNGMNAYTREAGGRYSTAIWEVYV